MRNVALSGEITLHGEILPVSGIREKVLAAQRGKVTMVVLPASNEEDVATLPEDITEGIEVVLADDIEKVTHLILR